MKGLYLWFVYLVMRIIKAPLFWVSISKYRYWKKTEELIARDTRNFWTFIVLLVSIYLIGWWTLFIVVPLYLIINLLLIVLDNGKKHK